MSFDPLTAAFDLGKIAIEKIWPDPTKRAQELRKLEELKQKGDIAQLNARVQLLTNQAKINEQEAKHKSVFVAGWRPFVGWICGLSLAYISIFEPIMRFVATMRGYTGDFPAIDTTITMQVLLGMLGLAVARTVEKREGVGSNSLRSK